MMGNRIYGCDDCLAVCPWNKFARQGHDAKLAARAELKGPALNDLVRLDEAGFRKLFAGTAIKRTGRDRFVRNVLIAIGNSRNPALATGAERLLNDSSAIVRGAAVWALGRLVAKQDLAAMAVQYASAEANPSVRDEWAAEGIDA
jgi:epoxyqueuosine reductase